MTDEGAGLRLTEAMVAYLARDLAGALGAVGQGVELAADPQLAVEALRIAAAAAEEATGRLGLIQAMLDPGLAPTRDDLARFAPFLPNGGRVRLDLAGLADRKWTPRGGGIVLACLAMAAEALHGAGTVALSGDDGMLLITLHGPRAAWPPVLADALRAGGSLPADLDHDLLPHLACLLARANGARLSFLLSAAAIPGAAPPLLLEV